MHKDFLKRQLMATAHSDTQSVPIWSILLLSRVKSEQWCWVHVYYFSLIRDSFTASKKWLTNGSWLQVLTNSCGSNPQCRGFPFPLPVKTHNCVLVLSLQRGDANTPTGPERSIYLVIYLIGVLEHCNILMHVKWNNEYSYNNVLNANPVSIS